MELGTVLSVLRSVAPEALAEPWDKVGLQVGEAGQAVARALLCIDYTEGVLAEAVGLGCELVVAYHPPIFGPLTELTDRSWKPRLLRNTIQAGVAVYAPHTALDVVRGGVNDWLAEGIAAGDPGAVFEPLEPREARRDEFKVVVFVPVAEAEKVRGAMAGAGAGGIGHYRECSWETAGVGGFRPVEGANPSIGEVGTRETVKETRLEMICPGSRLAGVLAALREAHSYEEPAFDVFQLAAEPVTADRAAGVGRLVRLGEAITGRALAGRVRERLGAPGAKLGGADSEVRTVALCVGAGGKLFEGVEADGYVTGEMQHHQALDLVVWGKAVVLPGHTWTERPYLPVYRDRLAEAAEALGGGVDWRVSEADAVPLSWVGGD
ncbi:MAG: Nif3-like dinuclear metal center hexameric protein [Planctomycetota bacterium]